MVLSDNVDGRKEKKGRNWEKQAPVPSQHHPHHHSEKVLSHQHLILQCSANWMEPSMNHNKCCTNIAEWLLVTLGEWPQDEMILGV